jgi:hypothetical protein
MDSEDLPGLVQYAAMILPCFRFDECPLLVIAALAVSGLDILEVILRHHIANPKLAVLAIDTGGTGNWLVQGRESHGACVMSDVSDMTDMSAEVGTAAACFVITVCYTKDRRAHKRNSARQKHGKAQKTAATELKHNGSQPEQQSKP